MTHSPTIGRIAALGLLIASVVGCTPSDDQTQIDNFNALARDPDQALDILYPDGVVEPGTSTEAIRLIQDNEWTDNEFDALANMLDAAATAHRTQDDPRSELSALAATDTINLLAERDTLPDTIDDSIGHIIANYIVDVNFLATIGPTPDRYEDLGQRFYFDLPPGAHFTFAAFQVVLPQVLSSERALQQVIDAANHLVNARVALNIVPGADQNQVFAPAATGAKLIGYLIGAAVASGASSPEWTTTAVNLLAGTPDALPAPGTTFADYITPHASELGQTYDSGSTPTSPADTKPNYADTTEKFAATATTGFINAVGLQLGEAGLLNQPADSVPLPWFVNNRFDPDIARQHSDEFEQYMAVGDSGWGDTARGIRKAIDVESTGW